MQKKLFLHDYQKTFKNINFIIYARSLLWATLSEKGPGTSYHSLFDSQNMHGEIIFLGDLSDLGNFDD